MRIIGNKCVPLKISRHSNRTIAKLVDCGIDLIGISFQDACEGVVRLLNLTNDDRLQLSA